MNLEDCNQLIIKALHCGCCAEYYCKLKSKFIFSELNCKGCNYKEVKQNV